MHNLHYVVVEAWSGAAACIEVEKAIESWGDENNWRTICGAVSAEGVIHNTGEGRWEIEGLNEVKSNVHDWVFGQSWHKKQFDEALAKLNAGVAMTSMDWYSVKVYAEEMSDKAWALHDFGNGQAKTTFDLFVDEFRSWRLDHCGVTHIGDLSKVPHKNLWVVAVDMHS